MCTVSLLINSLSVRSFLVNIYLVFKFVLGLNFFSVCHLLVLRTATAANTFVALTVCVAVSSAHYIS